jgi:hypothetical protein
MKLRSIRLWSSLSAIALGSSMVIGQASVGAATAATTRMHIVNKHAHVSFFLPRGFVHESAASYFEESLWDRALDVQILIQSPYGAVTIADGDIFLNNWLTDTNLQILQSKYVREHYGKVARLTFTNQPSSDEYPLSGEDLRFLDGSRSYDIVIDSTSSREVTKTANLILRTWGT